MKWADQRFLDLASVRAGATGNSIICNACNERGLENNNKILMRKLQQYLLLELENKLGAGC